MAGLAPHLAGLGLAGTAATAQAVRLVAVAVELCRRLLIMALGALLQVKKAHTVIQISHTTVFQRGQRETMHLHEVMEVG